MLNKGAVDVVIYHSPCDDGHSAASLFYYWDNTITMYGLHAKDDLFKHVSEDVFRDKHIVFVDIAFPIEVMTKVCGFAQSVTVLDHHVTNRTILESLTLPNLTTHFTMDVAGVCLAWKFIFGDIPIPIALKYIGLKDVWQHESIPEAVYFTTAFNRPKTWVDWIPYIENGPIVKTTIDNGKLVYAYQQSVLKIMMEKVQYTTWRGFRIAIVNVPFPWISDIGALMCESEPEKTIAVVWNKPANGPFSVSLRSHNPRGPNIEQIAVEFRGGGHVHGAGLRIDKPPYEVFTDTGEFV